MKKYDRYSRQNLVPQFGDLGQEKLSTARVLIVGGGGLGCTVATHLTGAGVGELLIVDHDQVSISNLHRQILFTEQDIGRNKAEQAKTALRQINSEIKISSISKRLSPENVLALCTDCNLVIDAADTFLASYLLSDACHQLKVPMLSASVNQTFGYIAGVCGHAPSLRAIFPKLPQQSTNCDTVGVTGPSVGVIASAQAQEALKILIDSKDHLLGQIIHFDLWAMQTHKIDFSSAREPNSSQIRIIGQQQAISERNIIIDVREASEIIAQPQCFSVQHQIPLAQLQAGEHALVATDKLAICCQSGQRALIAAQALINQGFTNVDVIAPS